MVSIKIECNGRNDLVGDIDMSTVVNASVDEGVCLYHLGKLLYAVESMGYPFKTVKIFDDIAYQYNNSKLSTKFKQLYNENGVKVSMRLV